MNYVKLFSAFLDMLDEREKRKTKSYDKEVEVTRVENGRVYVHIPGGIPETPVQKCGVDVKKGDFVHARVAGKKVWIDSNITHPSTDDTLARQALEQAGKAEERIDSVAAGAVLSDTIMYLATDQSTGVTRDTAGWQSTPPTISESAPYLWTYHIYKTNEGDITYTDPVLTGAYGERGANISAIVEYYAVNNDPDNAPADSEFTPNVQSPTATNRYLWNMEKIEYTDGSSSFMAKHVLMTWNPGAEGRGIASVTNYYARSETTTQPATSSFSTNVPEITSTYRYLWNYEVIAYTDGQNPTTTTPAIIGVYGEQGPQGIQGPQGASITSVVEYYLATSASSGVTRDTAGWTTSIQSMTATNQYLWNYEVIKSGSTTLSTTDPVIIGRYGQNGSAGKGISSVTNYYLATNLSSGVTTSTSGWTTAVQYTTSVKRYLWNYEVITYTDSSTSTSATRIIGTQGVDGTNGAKGDTGPTGPTGPQGVSVTGVVTYYCLSTSSSSAPGGPWSTTPQAFVHGRYYWTKERVSFSNSTTSDTTAVYNRALTDMNENAYAAKITAEGVAQYFWNKSSGGTTAVPTGSYVTEVPQSTFESSPQGGNLLLQSSAVKIRLAAVTLAELTGTGMNIYNSSGQVLASYGATESTLGGGKAKVKYQEGTAFGQNSHRVVVCKSADENNVRNDATLSSRDISTYTGSNYMAFVNAAHNNTSEMSDIHLWALGAGKTGSIDLYNTDGGTEVGIYADALNIDGAVDISVNHTTYFIANADDNVMVTKPLTVASTANVTGKLTAGAINNSLFTVTSKEFTVTASSTGNYDGTTSMTKSGYYPLAIAGYQIGTTGAYSRGAYLSAQASGSCTAHVRFYANTATNKSCTAYVLWVKTTA